jgi:hypothetical protein
MNNKFYTLLLMGVLLMAGCQTPDELLPPVARGLESVTASFEGGAGEFTATVTAGNYDIVIPIPYYFPEESDNAVTNAMLAKMRMKAVLGDNVTVEPALLFLDLSPGKTHTITVTDQRKEQHQYTIRGEIRKSNLCAIEKFQVTALNQDSETLNLDGVIKEADKTISLLTLDNLSAATVTCNLSPHATISPDPNASGINYNAEQRFVVTAHDGVTTATYTVLKGAPVKLPSGIRPNSAKIMFAKTTMAELGAPVHNHGGIAATKDYVLISTRTANSILINAKTGALIGNVDVSALGGNLGLTNFYNTADDSGNVLICNLAQNAGTFKAWRLALPSGTPQLYIDWSANTTLAIGRKISIQGSLDGNAIITAPLLTGTGNQFARWTVVGGTLTSQTPDIVSVNGITWTTNIDVVYTSATDVNADYFLARYGDHHAGEQGNVYSQLDWINGATHARRASLVDVNSNFIANAVDYLVFNNTPFAVVNYINGFTWGQADQIMLVNATTSDNFTADYTPWGAWPDPTGSVEWVCPLAVYGANAAGATVNTNAAGDVALVASDDGYYLYLYFMFTNGYVVGVQFDCIDM